jgi:hypothetical protein
MKTAKSSKRTRPRGRIDSVATPLQLMHFYYDLRCSFTPVLTPSLIRKKRIIPPRLTGAERAQADALMFQVR